LFSSITTSSNEKGLVRVAHLIIQHLVMNKSGRFTPPAVPSHLYVCMCVYIYMYI
jgi:hypothetical protein